MIRKWPLWWMLATIGTALVGIAGIISAYYAVRTYHYPPNPPTQNNTTTNPEDKGADLAHNEPHKRKANETASPQKAPAVQNMKDSPGGIQIGVNQGPVTINATPYNHSINASSVIDLCRRGISVTKVNDSKVLFDIPYCSGKDANAYNVNLETAIIQKSEDGLQTLLPFGDRFPDNITLTYETGKSISYILQPFSYDAIDNIYICVRGTYTNADKSINFPVLDIYKFNLINKNWVRTLGNEDVQVREYLKLQSS